MLKVIQLAMISIILHFRYLLPPRKPFLELSIKLAVTWPGSVRHRQVWPFMGVGRAERHQIYPSSLPRRFKRHQDQLDSVKAFHVFDLVGNHDL